MNYLTSIWCLPNAVEMWSINVLMTFCTGCEGPVISFNPHYNMNLDFWVCHKNINYKSNICSDSLKIPVLVTLMLYSWRQLLIQCMGRCLKPFMQIWLLSRSHWAFTTGALGETELLQFSFCLWPSRKPWYGLVLLLSGSWCICKGSSESYL